MTAALGELEEVLRRGETPDVEALCGRYPRARQRLQRVFASPGGASDAAPWAEPPARLGPYTLYEEIGRGGMATVYRAEDERLGREVALKVLHTVPLGDDSRRQRLLREARALAQSSHPNVVSVYDVGEDGPWCWIAMQRMRGSLAESSAAAADPAEVRDRVQAVLEAARGLAHAHAQGVLHRDVKPANLLVDDDGQVRVGDFGLARLDGAATLTVSGYAVGTLRYAAPEQLQGETVDEGSDVYGLGACLQALLTGEPPALSIGEATAAPEFPETVPAPLRAIVARATAISPSQRYPDMAAFGADLDGWLAGRAAAPARQRKRPPAIRRYAAPALVAAMALAALLLARWPAGPEPASGYLVAKGNPSGLSTRLFPKRADEHRDVADRTEFEFAGRRYVAKLEHPPLGDSMLTLAADGRTVGRYPLSPPAFAAPRTWRIRRRSVDVDADGIPELILQSRREVAIVAWERQTWRDPGLGWRISVPGRFGYGSPRLIDWDSDGRRELMVGDFGREDANGNPVATFYVIDPADGRRLAELPLSGWVTSTPRARTDADGRVAAVYLDTAADSRRQGSEVADIPARLWRFGADGDARHRDIPTPDAVTWPVFQDVDGDGTSELIIGGRRLAQLPEDDDSTGLIYCLREDLRGEPLWTFPTGPPAGRPSGLGYLLLSDQDGDGRRDLCYTRPEEAACIRTAPGLTAAERVIWRAPLQPHEMIQHEPVELGDLNGDGLAEIAGGTTQGRVVVLSAATAPELAWAVELPADISGVMRRDVWVPITARLAVRRDLDAGTVHVVAADAKGWLMGFRLPPAGQARSDALDWVFGIGHQTVASPAFVRVPTPEGDTVDLVLAACEGGWLVLVEPATGQRPGRARWGFQAEAGIGGTPAVDYRDGVPWAYFTDRLGHVYGVPLALQPVAELPDEEPFTIR